MARRRDRRRRQGRRERRRQTREAPLRASNGSVGRFARRVVLWDRGWQVEFVFGAMLEPGVLGLLGARATSVTVTSR